MTSDRRPTADEPDFHRQLVRNAGETFAGGVLADAEHLEHHRTGLHDRHPVIRVALTLTHPRLERPGGDGLMGEDPDVELPLAADVLIDGDTARLDRPGGDVARV